MAEFVSHEDARKMIRKHMQNLKALAACKRHDFHNEAEGEAGGRFCCTTCGGVVTDDQRRWYEQGVEHGRQAGVMTKKKT